MQMELHLMGFGSQVSLSVCRGLCRMATFGELRCTVLYNLRSLVQPAGSTSGDQPNSSAARPADKLEAVVLNGLLADRE